MNNKSDKTIHAYLNQIDSGPLLTRAQESELVKNVEVFQKGILDHLVVTKYARHELKTYLQSLDSSGESIIDISKKLHLESSETEQKEIASKFNILMKELEQSLVLDPKNLEQIKILLVDVSLTGTIIHGVVTEIKKKHARIQDVESKFKAVRKYFNDESDEVVSQQIRSNSEDLRARIKSEYSINDVKVTNKMNEWTNVLNEYDEVGQILNGASFSDVKEIYKAVAHFEHQASSFKNTLITKNLRLVISRASKFTNKGLDFEDLIQEGNIGLMKAIDKFDSSKKTKVSTYATWWIDQSIRRAISNKGKIVRVPTHIEWMQTKIAELTRKLTAELKRPPTLKELAEKGGYDLKQLEELQTRPQHEVGIDEELSSGMSLMDILPSDPSENPFSLTEQKILREKIRDILATLPPRTEKIIRLRFGIGEIPDAEGETLQAIADQVGITKQGVRVVECSAFKQLKKKARRLVNE